MRIRRNATAASNFASVWGYGGSPTSTRWHPTSSVGFSFASRTASSNAAPQAISVVDVRIPSRCASMIPRFTSGVKPKSSALTIRVRTAQLEEPDLDVQKLLGIGAEILQQALSLPHDATQILRRCRIVQEL